MQYLDPNSNDKALYYPNKGIPQNVMVQTEQNRELCNQELTRLKKLKEDSTPPLMKFSYQSSSGKKYTIQINPQTLKTEIIKPSYKILNIKPKGGMLPFPSIISQLSNAIKKYEQSITEGESHE